MSKADFSFVIERIKFLLERVGKAATCSNEFRMKFKPCPGPEPVGLTKSVEYKLKKLLLAQNFCILNTPGTNFVIHIIFVYIKNS